MESKREDSLKDQELMLLKQHLRRMKTEIVKIIDTMEVRIDNLLPECPSKHRNIVGDKKAYWSKVVDGYDW